MFHLCSRATKIILRIQHSDHAVVTVSVSKTPEDITIPPEFGRQWRYILLGGCFIKIEIHNPTVWQDLRHLQIKYMADLSRQVIFTHQLFRHQLLFITRSTYALCSEHFFQFYWDPVNFSLCFARLKNQRPSHSLPKQSTTHLYL